MEKLLNTNTNFYKARLRNYLLTRIQSEVSSNKQKLFLVLNAFDVEYNNENAKKRTPNLQDRLQGWLNCAPYIINLPVYYKDIIADCAWLHKVKTMSGSMQVTMCNNYHRHIAFHLLKYAKELNINLTKLY
jgi:hypothetical protein